MRSRATAYSVLTFLLFAFLPPALSVPPMADAGPFVDTAALQSSYLLDLRSRQAVGSGLTAILVPSGGGVTPPPGPALTSARPPGSTTLEARRTLRPTPAGIVRAPGTARAAAPVPAPVSAVTRKQAASKTAKATSTSPRASSAAALRHRVASGETLWSLARRYGVTVDVLVTTNGLASANQLRLGQVLTVPSSAATPTAMSLEGPPAAAKISHRVQPGDTLSAIAQRYGVSVDAIVAANGLSSRHYLRLGQVLAVPATATDGARANSPAPKVAATKPAAVKPAPAKPATVAPTTATKPTSISHAVQRGETLSAIARRYGTTVNAIVEANDLPSAHRLRIGQRLTVPVDSALGRAAARLDTAAAPPAAAVRGFIWPTRGLLTSRYGWRHRRHHDGIDLAAPHGSPIYAARAGRVVHSGWYYGYGRTVILDHGDGMTTLYGHASSLVVRTGQTVQRGQLIARVGSSGNSSGPHLHFEVRIGGRAVNPLRYLN